MSEKQIGEITHFFNKIHVGVLKLSDRIRLGDSIRITGTSTDFEQRVGSLQIDYQTVGEAGPGDDVAIKIVKRVRPGDKVFKIT